MPIAYPLMSAPGDRPAASHWMLTEDFHAERRTPDPRATNLRAAPSPNGFARAHGGLDGPARNRAAEAPHRGAKRLISAAPFWLAPSRSIRPLLWPNGSPPNIEAAPIGALILSDRREIDFTLSKMDPASKIIELYFSGGSDDYIGENITQIEHATQAATIAEHLYNTEPVSGVTRAQFTVAALLHDVGHLLDGEQMAGNLGGLRHEDSGADFLEKLGFCSPVVDLVRNHVAAKRYIVATDFGYMQRMSKASIETLALQGGPMNHAECSAFAASPLVHARVLLRHCDDAAKDPMETSPPFESFRPVIASCIN